MIRRACAALALLLAAIGGSQAQDTAPGRNVPGQFDFYVLSLSWSPSFCATRDKPDGQQCGGPRPYAFVVHGLWPQYERGYPDSCARPAPKLRQDQIRGMLDLMPSPNLITHEWAKHGTCSGLDATAYFDLVRAARARVVIPQSYVDPTDYRTVSAAEVETAFQAANPGLASDMIAVDCDRTRLREVRVCFTKDLAFRACPQVNAASCPAGRRLAVPPLR